MKEVPGDHFPAYTEEFLRRMAEAFRAPAGTV
jgi:hypothetical protein